MGRGSFWDRMERMAAEKEAARKEREEKRANPAPKRAAAPRSAKAGGAAPSRARASASAASPGRVKVMWSVRNHLGDQVAAFPYPERERAEAEALRLTEEKGHRHYVQNDKVPLD